MAGGSATGLRMSVLAVVVVALFSALFGRLWYLQVMAQPTLVAQAQAGQVRSVVVPPLRGRILDREGRMLATNVKQVVVTVERRAVRAKDDRDALFAKLAPVLDKAPADLERRFNSDRYDPLLPVPVAENVDESIAVFLKERQEEYPGVDVGEVASRVYTYGKVAAHVLGYVGKVSQDDVGVDVDCPLPDQGFCRYQLSDFVGKSGVERMFEAQLRGVPGYRKLEVDARGRVVRVVEDVPPTPGQDVQLTIDIHLQSFVEETLAQGLRYTRQRGPSDTPTAFFEAPAGAVTVLDTTNGQLLASVSYPTYDPREFVAGMSRARLEQLNGEQYDQPLFNRVTNGLYSPGSTFKVVSGLAAVQSGLRGAYEPYEDTPRYISPQSTDQRVFRSPSSVSLGIVDLARALAVSSDSYFYSIGNDVWAQLAGEDQRRALQDAAAAFGLGASTGVQLPGEASGRIPSPEVKKALFDANPGAFLTGSYVIGDNILAAIGQGDVLLTPLQLSNAYSAIANGGKVFSPNVALRIYKAGTADTLEPIVVQEFAPRLLKELTFPAGYLDQTKKGLRDVVTTEEGTAFRVFQGYEGMTVAGKTGTAQDFTKKSERDTSLFAAYGPFENPRYTVVAVLERSGFGSESATPVVRRVFEGLSDPSVIPPLAPAPFLDPAADFTLLPIESAGPDAPLPGSPPIARSGSRD